MQKYHIKTGFEHEKLLKIFLSVVNAKFRTLSIHAKQRILERIDQLEKIGHFLRDYKINFSDIIEYTFINGQIEKILTRCDFTEQDDIVFSITAEGKILTCYLNKKADKHYTLNTRQYA